jgi:oligopeptide transport system substrate-binding protein
MKRFWLPLLLALASAAQASELHRGNGGEPQSLDPHYVGAIPEANILADLLTGLTTLDAAGKPIPGAAESWTISPDGKIWTFRLREARWSDGAAVTADDFVFAWRRLLDPKTGARNGANMWVVKNARAVSAGALPPAALGVDAKDPRTLVVTLDHAAPYLPELLAGEWADPLPQHVLAHSPAGKDTVWSKPGAYVGNGPYLLREWLPNDHITLVKNPRFYDSARVAIDKVVYYPTNDAASALTRYRAGALDMQSPAPLTQLAWLRANLKGEFKITPSLALSYIAINLDDGALKDARVRRALNLVYNREAVTQKVLKLNEPAAFAIVPPGIANYPGGVAMDFKALPYPARVAEAQRLMQAAGYGPFNRLRLSFATTGNPDNKRLAAIFQAMAHQIYVDIDIEVSDFPTLMQNLRQHRFQLSSASWYADYDDAANFLDLLKSDAGVNYAHYRNAKFDALLDQAQSEPDAAKRGRLLAAAEKAALADYPWIPLRFPAQTDLVKPYVRGWIDNAADRHASRWLDLAR